MFENEPYCVLNYSQPKSQIQHSRAASWDFPETVALIKRCYFVGPQTQDSEVPGSGSRYLALFVG